MARYIPIDRDQMRFLPVTIDQLIDDNHLAKNIWYILDSGIVNLTAFDKNYDNENAGALAYNPKIMVGIMIYAYAIGIRSSRMIEKMCRENLAFMYLACYETPDHSTIAAFRTDHKNALESIFSQTIYLGLEADLIDLKHIATDGSKIESAGSINQIIKGESIDKRIENCEKIAKGIIEEAERIDNTEKQEKISKRKRKIELRFEKLTKAKTEYDQVKTGNKKKDEKIRYHLTEAEAKLMKDKDGFHSSYNAQASVDRKSQMIVDKRLTNKENDFDEGLIARSRLLAFFGVDKLDDCYLSFDNGYQNQELIRLDGEYGIKILISQGKESDQLNNNLLISNGMQYNREKDVFICPAGNELIYKGDVYFERDDKTYRRYVFYRCKNCEMNSGCFKEKTKNKSQKSRLIDKTKLELREDLEKFRNKMLEPEIITEYAKRKSTVEPVFAHITSHRFCSRFMVWGMEKAETEFTWMCIVHNLLKLINYSELNELKKVS